MELLRTAFKSCLFHLGALWFLRKSVNLSELGFFNLEIELRIPDPEPEGETWGKDLGRHNCKHQLSAFDPFPCCYEQVVPTYERMVVFRLGRIRTPQGPGMVLLLPFIDSFQRVDLRTRALSVPPCKVRGFLAPLDRGSGELVLGVLWMSVPWPASSHQG